MNLRVGNLGGSWASHPFEYAAYTVFPQREGPSLASGYNCADKSGLILMPFSFSTGSFVSSRI